MADLGRCPATRPFVRHRVVFSAAHRSYLKLEIRKSDGAQISFASVPRRSHQEVSAPAAGTRAGDS